jgi:pentose-5-phosphate-3-epimerase
MANKDASSTKVNANPDAASRAERDATAKHMMGSGSDRSFANMRKAQAENVTVHREAAETRKSRK